MVTPNVAVPVLLTSIAAIDGVLAGFRAATGRNGRIRKHGYYLVAMRRGLAAETAVLGCLTLVFGTVVATAPDPATRYTELTHAGTTMVWVIGPFAATVLASLLGYAALPRRPATFLILLGLGPFTLIRPWVTITAGLAAACTAPNLSTAGCAVLAATSVLTVEPWVHHRWYTQPA
jgi:heme/copper-type cytochrome/quinol oxidase subunit 1